jgi:hypothetical protein
VPPSPLYSSALLLGTSMQWSTSDYFTWNQVEAIKKLKPEEFQKRRQWI